MSYEEKDWIMRQIKQLAVGLGKMLGRDSLKEMINLELSASEKHTDEEIATIWLLVDEEEKIEIRQRKDEEISQKVGISRERLTDILIDYSLVTETEKKCLTEFIEKTE